MNKANRNQRRENVGIVLSNKMNKTVTVRVTKKIPHPRYGKIVQRHKNFHAHDESNELQEGQKVRIMETRPLSKMKRWRVVEVM